MIKTGFLIFSILGSFSIVNAKCRSWEYGTPTFCANLQLVELKRQEEESCYYTVEVKAYSPSEPKFKQSDAFEKTIQEKKLRLVKIPKNLCVGMKAQQEINGLIIGECHDNIGDTFFGLEHFFRKLFNKERMYADFKFSKSAKLTHIEDGKTTSYTATCQQQSSDPKPQATPAVRK